MCGNAPTQYMLACKYAGGTNYRGFDIANHWNEWAGGTREQDNGRCDYARFPSPDQQLAFARACQTQATGSTKGAEALVQEAGMFVLVNHWHWGLWALDRAVEEGTREFDHLTCAQQRIGRCFESVGR